MVKFNYGMKEKNPIDHIKFYKKSDPETGFNVPRAQESLMLPSKYVASQPILMGPFILLLTINI